MTSSLKYLADPGKARCCSTSTCVNHKLIESLILCGNIFSAPPRLYGLERTQKSFVKLILGRKYKNYTQALLQLNLSTLDKRRDILSLRWAKKCTENEKMAHMFPLNKKKIKHNTRKKEKYVVFKANTESMRRSPIIYMQNLLNKDHEETNRN